MSAVESEVLALLSKGARLSAAMACEALPQRLPSAVRRALGSLRSRGVVQRSCVLRPPVYFVEVPRG